MLYQYLNALDLNERESVEEKQKMCSCFFQWDTLKTNTCHFEGVIAKRNLGKSDTDCIKSSYRSISSILITHVIVCHSIFFWLLNTHFKNIIARSGEIKIFSFCRLIVCIYTLIVGCCFIWKIRIKNLFEISFFGMEWNIMVQISRFLANCFCCSSSSFLFLCSVRF